MAPRIENAPDGGREIRADSLRREIEVILVQCAESEGEVSRCKGHSEKAGVRPARNLRMRIKERAEKGHSRTRTSAKKYRSLHRRHPENAPCTRVTT
jgi:hypothetical protein